MNILFIIPVLFILIYIYNKENFKSSNSLDIVPTGINVRNNDKTNISIIKKIKSIPIKKYAFQTEPIIPVLRDEEIRLITSFLKRHFPKFLEIVRFKKEQQQNVVRYDVVFMIKDTNPYNHVIITKIIVKDGKIFFNTLEYGGMILPNEMPSKQKGEELFFIGESNNKIIFLDNKIKSELNKFEKRKIDILLRRGRKAS